MALKTTNSQICVFAAAVVYRRAYACATRRFLNLPFDLSQVVFIATANEASAISRPLLDRMETLEMTSYSLDQKLRIAQRHIVPRQLVEHALQPDDVLIADDAIARIIEAYTQEAGVRELERQIAAVARWAAMRVARAINGGVVETDTRSSELNLPIEVAASSIGAILGKERYARSRSLLRHAAQNAGVALGLAVNGVGGDVLVIETSLSPGDGKLLLTGKSSHLFFAVLSCADIFLGKLGDVLKESAQVAISWLRSKADVYHLDLSEFNKVCAFNCARRLLRTLKLSSLIGEFARSHAGRRDRKRRAVGGLRVCNCAFLAAHRP